jgi:type 1 glutamine amidotransferase
MYRQIIKVISGTFLALALLSGCQGTKMKALIVTGQNSNNWETSSEILSTILENSDLFKVDVAISPAKGEEMTSFAPSFEKYDVLVLDYNGDEWSDETKANFESYLNAGGGLVVYHAANNSFPGWEAYNSITGLSEAAGELREFVVVHKDAEHPILKGIPERWMQSRDMLYSEIQAPSDNRTILATALSDAKRGGSGKHEPVIYIIEQGKSRIFHTTLGYVDENRPISLQSAGFILTLQRGAEWAATGIVTQNLPIDLPNAATPLILSDYKFYSLDELFSRAKFYEFGKPEKYLYLISNRIILAKADPLKLKDYEKRIIELLESDATAESKNYLCRELSWMGSDASIPALEKLLGNEDTKDMADFALQRLQK